MSEDQTIQETNHAILVEWEQYAHCLGTHQEFTQAMVFRSCCRVLPDCRREKT
jgi:hypothetical protein